eukprot:PhM_4_TR3668/c0_g1_i1/m.76387
MSRAVLLTIVILLGSAFFLRPSAASPQVSTLLGMFTREDRTALGWVCNDTSTCSPCGWTGVTCDTSGNVAALSLVGLGLSGTLPPHLVLPNIVNLTISLNSVGGTIPGDLCVFSPQLQRVYLSRNEFTGSFPSCIRTMNSTSILTVDVSDNRLSGEIPAAFLQQNPRLQGLSVAFNSLTGSINTALTPELTYLDIRSNLFTTPPPCGKAVVYLADHNDLEGHVPRCSSTLLMTASHNSWTCPLPSNFDWLDRELTQCTANPNLVVAFGAVCGAHILIVLYLVTQFTWHQPRTRDTRIASFLTPPARTSRTGGSAREDSDSEDSAVSSKITDRSTAKGEE